MGRDADTGMLVLLTDDSSHELAETGHAFTCPIAGCRNPDLRIVFNSNQRDSFQHVKYSPHRKGGTEFSDAEPPEEEFPQDEPTDSPDVEIATTVSLDNLMSWALLNDWVAGISGVTPHTDYSSPLAIGDARILIAYHDADNDADTYTLLHDKLLDEGVRPVWLIGHTSVRLTAQGKPEATVNPKHKDVATLAELILSSQGYLLAVNPERRLVGTVAPVAVSDLSPTRAEAITLDELEELSHRLVLGVDRIDDCTWIDESIVTPSLSRRREGKPMLARPPQPKEDDGFTQHFSEEGTVLPFLFPEEILAFSDNLPEVIYLGYRMGSIIDGFIPRLGKPSGWNIAAWLLLRDYRAVSVDTLMRLAKGCPDRQAMEDWRTAVLKAEDFQI